MHVQYRLKGEAVQTVLDDILNQQRDPPFIARAHGSPYPSLYNIGVQLPNQPDDEGPTKKIEGKPFWILYTLEPKIRPQASKEERKELENTPPTNHVWRAIPVVLDILYKPGAVTHETLAAYQQKITSVLRGNGARREFTGGLKSFLGYICDRLTPAPRRERTYENHSLIDSTLSEPAYGLKETELSEEGIERRLEQRALSPQFPSKSEIHKF